MNHELDKLDKSFGSKLKSGYRFGHAKALFAMHGKPHKHTEVILVTGASGQLATGLYLKNILEEANMKVAVFMQPKEEGASDKLKSKELLSFFKAAKKDKADYVILGVEKSLLIHTRLDFMPIKLLVLTEGEFKQDEYDAGSQEAFVDNLYRLNSQLVALCHDNEEFDSLSEMANKQQVSYGTDPSSEVKIKRVKLYKLGSEVRLSVDSQTELELGTHLPGKNNVYNLVAAASGAYLLGIKLEDIVEGAANVEVSDLKS